MAEPNEGAEIHKLRQEIHELRSDISDLREEVADLVQLWTDAKGFITVIKWLSGLGISLAAFIVAIREAFGWIKS